MTLFVVRKVYFEGLWHLRCIDCGICKKKEYALSSDVLLHKNGRTYRVRSPHEECETSGIPLGPLSVYGTCDAIKSLPPETRLALNSAQNAFIVVTDDDCTALEPHGFLTNEKTVEFRCEAKLRFGVTNLDELPDCIRELGAEDDPLFRSSTTTAIDSIPTMFFLPGSINQDGIDFPVVYQVREWLGIGLAKVGLFICGDFHRSIQGHLLERKTCLRSGSSLTVHVGAIETIE